MLHRLLCDQQQQLQAETQCELRYTKNGTLVTSRLYRQTASHILDCTCSRRTYMAQSWSSIRRRRFYQLQISSHDRSCPLYRFARKAEYIETGINFCSSYLRFSLQIALSMTKGAGGFSIGPRLNVRTIVPYDSPASDCLNQIFSRRWVPNYDFDEFLESALQHILGLFNEGKAAPTDLTPDGRTLLHVRALDAKLKRRD